MDKLDFDDAAQMEALAEYLRSAEGMQEMMGQMPGQRNAAGKQTQQPTNYLYNSSFRFGLSIIAFALSIVAFNKHEVFFQ